MTGPSPGGPVRPAGRWAARRRPRGRQGRLLELGTWQTRRPTAPRRATIPVDPGVYRFRDAARPGHLRRQGQEPAQRLNSYFADLVGAAPAHRADGHHRAPRRVDRRRHRGRGAAAGVLLDQGVRPAVQRPVPRRQVLPLPRRHARRGVPAAAGDARRQAQGRALLRAVLARLGDPRDARPAAAGLPGAHLLRRGVQARRPDRPAVPARLHRQVLGALRRPGRPPRSTGRSSRTSATSWPATPTRFVKRLERRDARGRRRAWSSSGPPGCATTSARCTGDGEAGRRARATAPTPTWSPSPRTSSRPRSRSSTSAAAGSAASAAGWSRRTSEDVPASWSSTSAAGLRRRGADARAVPREVLVPGRCPPTPTRWPSWLSELRGARVDLRVPQRGDKKALMETVAPQRRAGARPAQARAGRRPHRPQPGARRRSQTRSSCTTRRCASSASTSPTSRAPTSSRRMVVFEDGLARKCEYRRFIVRGTVASG